MKKLELIRQIVTGEREFPPSGRLLGLTMLEANEGSTVIEMPIADQFMNMAGGVQGGFLAALADANMGTSLATVCDVNESHATIEFKLNFMRPATKDKGPLRATAHVLRKGARIAHTTSEIRGASGELVAKATASWIVRKLPDADRE